MGYDKFLRVTGAQKWGFSDLQWEGEHSWSTEIHRVKNHGEDWIYAQWYYSDTLEGPGVTHNAGSWGESYGLRTLGEKLPTKIPLPTRCHSITYMRNTMWERGMSHILLIFALFIRPSKLEEDVGMFSAWITMLLWDWPFQCPISDLEEKSN